MGSFYTYSWTKTDIFDPLPQFVHVVIEWPLSVKLLVEKLTAMMEIFFIALITSKDHTKLYVLLWKSIFCGKIVMGPIANKL